ncbi:transposase [Craurococcus roseus]|uniref:transposase n=1 Tax=Craurococcus roseus TaxID=77585 RepID=UPI0038CF4883
MTASGLLPARFHSPGALAAHLGVVPALRQSGKRNPARAAATRFGNARLRTALWMPTLSAVRRNPWLRAFYERLRTAGKPPKLALYTTAKNSSPSPIPQSRRGRRSPSKAKPPAPVARTESPCAT